MSNRHVPVVPGSSQTPLEGYDTLTVKRLRLLCTAREIPTRGSSLKRHFVHALEEDDGKSRFPFLDLPPEIRNEIYGYLVDEIADIPIGDLDHTPVPALAGTCRSIRRESLPVFFAKCPITVSMDPQTIQGKFIWGIRRKHVRWISNLRPEEVANVTSLFIFGSFDMYLIIDWSGASPEGQEIRACIEPSWVKECMEKRARRICQPAGHNIATSARSRGVSAPEILDLARAFSHPRRMAYWLNQISVDPRMRRRHLSFEEIV